MMGATLLHRFSGLFLAALIFLLILSASQAFGASQPQKNILILHSYHKGLGWTDDQNEGIIHTFRQQGIEPIFHVEYMDWKYNPTEENLRLRYDQYKQRYQGRKTDLILTTDDAALAFAIRHRQELFSDAPIIYTGVLQESAPKLTQGQTNLTGIQEKFDAAGTIGLMRLFDPELQRIFLLYDNSESGLQAARVMTAEARQVDPNLQLTHLNTATFGMVVQTLGSLPPNSHNAVLVNTYSRDVAGLSMEMERFVKLFAESSSVPLYILYDFDSGYGAVGGSLAVGRVQGEEAAKLGVKILNGVNADSLPVVAATEFTTILDYTQLMKHRLPVQKIPPQALLINRPPTFYERYRETIWATAMVFSLMSVIITLLLLNIHNRMQSEHKLAAARTYLDKIINSVGDPIFVKDAKYRWVLINQAFANFMGRSKSDLLGKTAYDMLPPVDAASHQQQDARVLANGEEHTYLATICDGHDQRRVLEHKKTRYTDVDGNHFVVAIIRDITTIKRAEEILQQTNEDLEEKITQRTRELAIANMELTALNEEMIAMNEALQDANQTLADEVHERRRVETELQQTLNELQQAQEQLIQSGKLAALGSLVAGVAHEINTPLGNSVTAASYLRVSLDDFSARIASPSIDRSTIEEYVVDQQDGLLILEANLRRAVELVRSFKNVATDQMQEEKHSFNVSQSLADTVLTLRPRLKKTRLQLTVECPQDLTWNSYPGILSQIITNLVTNSVIHAYQPQQEGQMRLTVFPKNSTMVLDYSDNGCGMNATVREKIFDPFFTTKRGSGGTGLGLYIVYNLVTQKLGGTIDCTSTPGSGARFVIQVPIL